MVYEGRPSPGSNYLLAGACLLLSILGFAAAGVIPTRSGEYPLVGWSIVALCFAGAFFFLRRARSGRLEVRIDEKGIFVPGHSAEIIPWDQITARCRCGWGFSGWFASSCAIRSATRRPDG